MKDIFALRCEVFVKEQNVPREIELDSYDEGAIHIIALDGGIAFGCARIIIKDGDAHIGRLAVKKEKRGTGIGSALCRYCLEVCRERGYPSVTIHAQHHALEFYERLGFKSLGEPFYEAGILHIEMKYEVAV